MLSKKQHTLTEISHELGLSPSTVKQHIDELQAMGAIQPVYNEFIKRWKYYTATPNFEINGTYVNRLTRFTKINPYYVGSIVVIMLGIAVFAYALLSSSGSINTSGTTSAVLSASPTIPNYTLSVMLTDPPTVPDGTNALELNYSSMAINVVNSSGVSNWINVSGKGSVNLMSLVNVSQLIGNLTLSANDMIVGIRLNATSSYITIDNSTYNVLLAENSIAANIRSQQLDSNSVILADFSPVVVSVFSSNATKFLLVPSVKAILYGSSTIYPASHRQGAKGISYTENLTQEQRQLLSNASSGVSIINANIITSGSNEIIAVTVKNTLNRTVTLRQLQLSGSINSHVMIGNDSQINVGIVKDKRFPSGELIISQDSIGNRGHLNANLPPFIGLNVSDAINSSINSDVSGNPENNKYRYYTHGSISTNSSIAASSFGNDGIGQGISANATAVENMHGNSSVNLPLSGVVGDISGGARGHSKVSVEFPSFYNISINSTALNVSANITPEEELGISHAYLRQLTFLIEPNSTLVLARSSNMAEFEANGYALAPGASVTLAFNGSINYGNGRIIDTLVSGNSYGITIMGDPGVLVHSNTTTTAS